MWFIGVEVEQETSAPPPKKNPGSAPGLLSSLLNFCAISSKILQNPAEVYGVEASSSVNEIEFLCFSPFPVESSLPGYEFLSFQTFASFVC